MLLRSRVTPEEKEQRRIDEEKRKEIKANEEQKPCLEYNGKLKYYTTLIDCAMSCDLILDKVKSSAEIFPIGFDLEWPFSYQTGSAKTAVIQMSPSLEECYIFHVTQIRNLPKSLIELISHSNVRLVGVNIKNDIRKLARDFPGIDGDKVVTNCIDASSQANTVLGCRIRWSMARLVEEFMQMSLNKDKKVRNSKWHIIPLTEKQQKYAATDSYASLKLYYHLEMLREVAEKENIVN